MSMVSVWPPGTEGSSAPHADLLLGQPVPVRFPSAPGSPRPRPSYGSRPGKPARKPLSLARSDDDQGGAVPEITDDRADVCPRCRSRRATAPVRTENAEAVPRRREAPRAWLLEWEGDPSLPGQAAARSRLDV